MKTIKVTHNNIFTQLFLLFLPIIFFLKAGTALANSSHSTSGKLSIYSTTKDNTKEKRDTVVLWSDAFIQANENLDTVVVVWGNVQFYGKARDLVVLGGDVTLHEGASVHGSLVVLGGKLHKNEGATVSEQVLFELPKHLPSWILTLGPIFTFLSSDGVAFLYILVRAVFICLLGAIIFVVAPMLVSDIENYVQGKPFQSVGYSFLGALFFIPGLIVLLISIIGIMFIPLFLMFYFFVYYFFSYVLAANILGQYLPPRKSSVMPPLRFFYGVFIMSLISTIPVIGMPIIYLGMLFTSGATIAVLSKRVGARFRKIH